VLGRQLVLKRLPVRGRETRQAVDLPEQEHITGAGVGKELEQLGTGRAVAQQ
jgi:hypothetical protein